MSTIAAAVILASLSSPGPQTMPFANVLENIDNIYGNPDPNPSADLSGQKIIMHKMEDLSSSFFDSSKFCTKFFEVYIRVPVAEGLIQPFSTQFFYMSDTYTKKGYLTEDEVYLLKSTKNIVINCGYDWEIIVNYFRQH